MKELIKISTENGKRIVNARDLHGFLESRQQYADWIKHRLDKFGFVENEDFIVFHNLMKNPSGGRTKTEHGLTLDTAKELCMLENNEKGREARKYFIECERQAKDNGLLVPKSPTEIILFAAQQLHEQSLRMDNIEEKVRVIEASKETNDGGYVAIMGYARLVNKPIDVGTAAKLGRKAKSICSTLGYEVFSVSDPRFGRVNTYPKEVLETVFNEYFQ